MNYITTSRPQTNVHAHSRFFVSLCSCALFVLPVFLFSPTFAQQRSPAKDIQRAQRERAVELIVETADAARTFKDLIYRARLQTLAADALWPHDEHRARNIFRRAWEAATACDKAEQEQEELESGVPSTIPITNARDEVLTTAAARDSKLAEAFLKDLLTEKPEQGDAAKNQPEPARRAPWRAVSVAGQRRLALAYELLRLKNPTRAAEVAAPVIAEGESGDLMAFITRLGEADYRVAEEFYLRLLERTRLSKDADANTVLLLSTQIMSPWLLVVVDERGSIQFRGIETTPTDPAVLPFTSQPVRRAFYDLAATILLRPFVPRAGPDMNVDSIALYFVTNRLLPYFERESPAHVSDLRLRSSTLANGIDASRREALNSQLGLTSLRAAGGPGDVLRAQIDQLGRARDARDRDRIALGIVRKAARGRLWDRARRAALEIENVDLRRSALSFLAIHQIADLLRAFSDDKEANFERLAKFVRNADVPALGIAWGLAQVSVIAAGSGDKQSAIALLDEAQQYAARTPAGTRQRVAAYTAVARIAISIDLKRAWDLFPEIVRAANAVDDLNGDESSIDIELAVNDTEEEIEELSLEADVFRLDSIFATMARLDSDKSLAEARSIGKETPRAFAMLAIARVMLKTGHRTQDTELRTKG